MNTEYELPYYWVAGAEKWVTDSTADYIFDDFTVIN